MVWFRDPIKKRTVDKIAVAQQPSKTTCRSAVDHACLSSFLQKVGALLGLVQRTNTSDPTIELPFERLRASLSRVRISPAMPRSHAKACLQAASQSGARREHVQL